MAYTTSWKFTEAQVGLQPIAETSTTQNHPLGIIRRAVEVSNSNGEGEFVYLKGVASTVAGSWVTYNTDDGTTALLAANAIGPVAVAMSANAAATSYGWYQINGKAVGKALAAFADDANVYATATAGSVDDAVVAGDRVKRCKGASALDFPSTGTAEFEIDRPFMDDAVAA
jgi:hypothetical protein